MNLSRPTTEKWLTAARLANQQISTHQFSDPERLISWFGGIQAQDYPSSKWAIGLRIPGITEDTVEKAVAGRSIIRTWAMRGTLHLVSAGDIRWLTGLLAPRIIAAGKSRNRQLELDDVTFNKCNEIIGKSLQGGKALTRHELAAEIQKAGISTAGQRLIHILQRASLDKLICHGTKPKGDFTFSLLDECVPPAPSISREEALAEITKRYFTSHGPATLQDFLWWSGLTVADARNGLDAVKSMLSSQKTDESEYWFRNILPEQSQPSGRVYLLPAFDEYVIGYRDRSAFFQPDEVSRVISTNGVFYPVIVAGGRVQGIWKRTTGKDRVVVELDPFRAFTGKMLKAINDSVGLFGNFTGKKAEI
jgi:hypothetical protein